MAERAEQSEETDDSKTCYNVFYQQKEIQNTFGHQRKDAFIDLITSQKNNARDAGGAGELQKQNTINIPDFAPSEDAPRSHAPRQSIKYITIHSASSGHSQSPLQDEPIDINASESSHFNTQLTEAAQIRKVQKMEEDKLHSEIKDMIRLTTKERGFKKQGEARRSVQ